MNRLGFLPHLMLVAIVAMTAACAGTPKGDPVAEAVSDYKARIRQIVTDEARADALLQLVDQADAQRRAAEAEAAAFAAEFQRLNADYDATKDQFTALMARHRADRRGFADALLALRAKMVAGTTPAEWDAISKIRQKTLETIFRAELPAKSPASPSSPARLTSSNGGASC